MIEESPCFRTPPIISGLLSLVLTAILIVIPITIGSYSTTVEIDGTRPYLYQIETSRGETINIHAHRCTYLDTNIELVAYSNSVPIAVECSMDIYRETEFFGKTRYRLDHEKSAWTGLALSVAWVELLK